MKMLLGKIIRLPLCALAALTIFLGAAPVTAWAQPVAAGGGSVVSVNAQNSITTYLLQAGSNRLLVVTVSHADNGGLPVTSVPFGAQPLSQAALSTDGSAAMDSIWILPLGSSASSTSAAITVVTNIAAGGRPCSFISAQQ